MCRVYWDTCCYFCNTGISWGCIDLGGFGVLGKCPCERVFSAAASNYEYFHAGICQRRVLGLHLFPSPDNRVLLQAEIIACDAGVAHFVFPEPDSLGESFYVVVSEPVNAYLVSDLLVQFRYRKVVTVDPAGQEFFSCGEVDAHVAWVADRRECYDHVDLL